MAASTMKFVNTEIASAINFKLIPENKGNNIDSKYQLNGQDLWYSK